MTKSSNLTCALLIVAAFIAVPALTQLQPLANSNIPVPPPLPDFTRKPKVPEPTLIELPKPVQEITPEVPATSPFSVPATKVDNIERIFNGDINAFDDLKEDYTQARLLFEIHNQRAIDFMANGIPEDVSNADMDTRKAAKVFTLIEEGLESLRKINNANLKNLHEQSTMKRDKLEKETCADEIKAKKAEIDQKLASFETDSKARLDEINTDAYNLAQEQIDSLTADFERKVESYTQNTQEQIKANSASAGSDNYENLVNELMENQKNKIEEAEKTLKLNLHLIRERLNEVNSLEASSINQDKTDLINQSEALKVQMKNCETRDQQNSEIDQFVFETREKLAAQMKEDTQKLIEEASEMVEKINFAPEISSQEQKEIFDFQVYQKRLEGAKLLLKKKQDAIEAFYAREMEQIKNQEIMVEGLTLDQVLMN